MQYKKYDCNAYNIYSIKTDKFKSCIINVVFRNNIEDENIIPSLSLLKSVLVENNKNYKTRRELVIKQEELYNASFSAGYQRLGHSYEFDLTLDFINPYYVKEKQYLGDVITYLFDMITNPNVENDEFDLKTFNNVKDRRILALQRIHENPAKYAIKRSLLNMDKDSISAKYIEKEDLDKITPSSLYKTYKQVLNNSLCDIYVVGDLDMDEVVSKIKKVFDLKVIKNHPLELYVQNKKRKKVQIVKEEDHFAQANLIVGYNIDSLNEKEKIAFRVFNEIFGGGMNSKLYQNLRIKNSLCYGVSSLYYKYDNLLLVHLSFDQKNYEKALKLIETSMKEMKEKKITEEEFMQAKKSLQFSFKLSKDSINSIMNNYMFYNLGEVPLVEEYENALMDITLEDVLQIGNKLHQNFVYLLGQKEEIK